MSNVRIGSSKTDKFTWKQSPVVVDKYQERSFPATYCSNESLHLMFLKAILLMNQAHEDNTSERPEQAVSNLRQCAGIFQYLASDKCRNLDKSTAPIEFQTPILNSFMNLALAQVYSIIAAKGERDGTAKTALAKICYTASTTYQTALDAARTAKPAEAFHRQYTDWLEQMAALYHAYACVLFAFAQKQKDEIGMAIGLIRRAINGVQKVDNLYPKNERPNTAIRVLIEKLQPIDKKWAEENFLLSCKPLADESTADRFIATAALTPLNLSQPIPYSPPEAGETGSESPVVKKIPPSEH